MVKFYIPLLLFISCSTVNHNYKTGYVEFGSEVWSSDSLKYLPAFDLPKTWFLYNSNYVISYKNMVNWKSVEYPNRTWDTFYVSKVNYLIYDLKKEEYNEYDTLKLDAKFRRKFKKYDVIDSSNIGFDWHFYKDGNGHYLPKKQLKELPWIDTIVNGFNYKMYYENFTIDTFGKKYERQSRWYISNEFNNSPIHLSIKFDKENDCRLIMWEIFPLDTLKIDNVINGRLGLYYKKESIFREHKRIMKKWIKQMNSS